MSSENMENTVNKRNNRKRKKSFLRNARKYAKKGHFGRGSNMEADDYQYFVRIMEAYREGFDNEEDKSNFVNNVFEQTQDKEINCSCNQVGCRVIETLLPFANDSVMQRFMKQFSEDIRPLCSDRFATHVMEVLVSQSCERALKQNCTEDNQKIYKDFGIKVSKFLLNNLEDFIWDTYGNHVIRTCLISLSQIPKEDKKNNHNSKKQVDIKVEEEMEIPSDFIEIIRDYAERLLAWPQFNELCSTEVTSGFLQVLLKALKKVDSKILKKYLSKFLSDTFAPETDNHAEHINAVPQVFLSTPAMMLLETALQVAKSKMFSKIYAKCFAGKLVKLAKTRSTNFAVQKLLNHCEQKVEFELMFDELTDHFQDIINAGHSGVVYAIGQACKRLSAKQGNYVQCLMKCFNCFEPEERQNDFVICMSRFTSFENCKNQTNETLQKDKLNLHGTLILQLILEFNKPIKVINSILSMDTNDVKNLFSNSMGSHIVDSYVKSNFVGEKSREKLVRKMQGTYQELASSKHGSRCFEALWGAANIKCKLGIMDELVYKDGAWSNSDHGKIIAGKVNLVLYKRSKDDWKNSLNKNKVDDVFKDLME